MAQCLKCGADLAATEVAIGVCYPCEKKLSPETLADLKAGSIERLRQEAIRAAQQKTETIAKAEEQLNRKEAAEKFKAAMILTTETYPAGIDVAQRLQIVTAECVFGMNMLSDFVAEVTDLVGGRSGTTQRIFREARTTVLNELREEAYTAGGNAVIGVNIQYSQLTGKGTAMLMVVATGTAVTIAKQRSIP